MRVADFEQLGLTLSIGFGDRLNYTPVHLATPDILAKLRTYRHALLLELRAEALSQLKAPAPVDNLGVGTELRKLSSHWNTLLTTNGYAQQLNQRGISWCDDNQAEIVNVITSLLKAHPMPSAPLMYELPQHLSRAIRLARYHEAAYYAEQFSKTPLTALPNDTLVVTAADGNFILGVMLLAWTLWQRHRCRIRCYDLGIDNSLSRKQLEQWGVEFIACPKELLLPRRVPAWQIFNKPVFINDALTDNKQVLWLDADCYICGDLSTITEKSFFIPDHGIFDCEQGNKTPAVITAILGPDKSNWHHSHFPCAGIIGIHQCRQDIIDEWMNRTKVVVSHDKHQACVYYDQTILQTFIDDDLGDGVRFSNFSCPRQADQRKIFDYVLSHLDVQSIQHSGGLQKPFLDWKPTRWPIPRGAALFSENDYVA